MFYVVEDFSLIKKYQTELREELRKQLYIESYNEIGFPGGSINELVFSNPEANIWCSMADELLDGSRYWNPFGIGNPQNVNHLTPIVEINIPPFTDRRIGGVFIKDSNQNIYLGHRGKIGGGKRGIGKIAFFEKYTGNIVDANDGEHTTPVAIISAIHDINLITNIKRFVFAVNIIKENGKNIELDFSPEAAYRKPYIQEKEITPLMEHAYVVNSLAFHISKNGEIPYNSQKIDIYTLDENGCYKSVYEVKSKTDTQSIYTAIGQLYYHTAHEKRSNKIIVIPENVENGVINTIRLLGITIYTYKIENNQISFINIQ